MYGPVTAPPCSGNTVAAMFGAAPRSSCYCKEKEPPVVDRGLLGAVQPDQYGICETALLTIAIATVPIPTRPMPQAYPAIRTVAYCFHLRAPKRGMK